MTTTGLDLLDRALAEANEWVGEIMKDVGDSNRHRAYSALRSVLHAVRDYLPFEDAMIFSAQLPAVVRGFFLDGWKHGEGPAKDRTREAFLQRVAERIVEVPDLEPDLSARAVFGLLARRIEAGMLSDVRNAWAEPLNSFWPGTPAAGPSLPGEPRFEHQERLEKTRREIERAIDRAHRDGVPAEELPELTSRRRTERRTRPVARGAGPAGLDVFDKGVQKTNLWLRDLLEMLTWDNPKKAFRGLLAVLHTLRDRLTISEAFQLGTQLPMILRGFYFEGWDATRAPTKERSKQQFLDRVAEKLRDEPEGTTERLARAVFGVLTCHVTDGEIEDVRSSLPKHLRDLWPDERPASPQETLTGKLAPKTRGGADGRRRARARKARKEIRSAIARARVEGVRGEDLPVLMSRRALRGRRARKQRRPVPKWYAREQKEEFLGGGGAGLPPAAGKE